MQSELDARDHYETALEAYFAQRFAEAAAGFGLAGRLRPDDRAADVMLQRCLDLAAVPPKPEWDGVFTSAEK